MKADKVLDSLEVSYEELIQNNPTESCDDAAKERGLETNQIVKSLIIESNEEKFHVLLPGDRSLSEKKFGSEYKLIPPEDSKELTGFESGTVHPFSTELDHVIDERICGNEKISHTVGEKRRAVILSSDGFREALRKSDFNIEIRDIAVSTQKDYSQVEDKNLDEESARFIVDRGYRKIFLELSEKYESGRLLNLFKAFNREDLNIDTDRAEEVLERAENQTHIQRLTEKLSNQGELPEASGFDLVEEVSEIINENPDAVEDYRDGQESALNFFIGQLMQKTNGKADAGEARKKFTEELE